MIKLSAPVYSEAAAAALKDCLRGQPNAEDPDRWHRAAVAALAAALDVPKEWVLLTNSCTAALHLATLLLDPARPVEAPALTWPSTYSYAQRKNLVDSDWDGWSRWSDRDDVVRVMVALWGRPVPEPTPPGLVVLDSAHAFGYGIGLLRSKAVQAVAYSFGAIKEITTGRGGALVSPHVNTAVRAVADSGTCRREGVVATGWNYGMTEHAAALLPVQLEQKEKWKSHRQALLRQYGESLQRLPLDVMTAPGESSGHLMVVRFLSDEHKIRVQAALTEAGVQSGLHYGAPWWLPRTAAPTVAALERRLMSLPLHCGIGEKDVDHVCRLVVGVLGGKSVRA